MLRMRAALPSARSTGDSSTGSSMPTATRSTPTSGCSRISTATVSGWADRAALIDALSVLPEYLRNRATDSGEVIDYRDWHVPLGRRFRALKLWFVIRHYGAEGLRSHVRRSVELAEWFAEQVEASGEFELAAPVSVGLVCFCHREGDAFNQALMERLNRSGAPLPHPHQARRPARASSCCRRPGDPPRARRGGVGAHRRGGATGLGRDAGRVNGGARGSRERQCAMRRRRGPRAGLGCGSF